MKLIITEKPSVAKEIAKVLNVSKGGEGCIYNDSYHITWAFGHLIELASPESYDASWKAWSLESLPIFPSSFNLTVKNDGGVKKQFNIIKKLLKSCTSVINAGDIGREGELIQRWILQVAGYTGKVERLWLTDMTEQGIKEGFSNLRNSSDFDALFRSAQARSQADWLVGLNATRCLTLSTNSSKPLSMGRVQTPVMAMICERYLDNKNFKPSNYFVPTITLNKDNIQFTATLQSADMILDKSFADQNLFALSSFINCSNAEIKTVTESNPLPHDLTSLQVAANNTFGYTAQQTLDITQALYETHKAVTYPRTDSRYITEELFSKVPNLLYQSLKVEVFSSKAEFIDFDALPKKCVNNAKITDHHAIIPTNQKASSLKLDEANVYYLIVSQFLAAFAKPCVLSKSKYIFTEKDIHFVSTGTVVLELGFRSFLQKEDAEAKEETEQKLPIVHTSDSLPIVKSDVLSKLTKPKPLFTEATLLKAMENAGKLIEDDELSSAIKDSGIGTPATRSNIIETNIRRAYIFREKKNLIPSETGIELYNQIKEFSIASPLLTGEWEFKLNQIALNSLSDSRFIGEIKEYTSDLIKSILSLSSMSSITSEESVPCPLCGVGSIKKNSKAFGCSNWKNNCSFTIWNSNLPAKFSINDLRKAIEANTWKSLLPEAASNDSLGLHRDFEVTVGKGKFGPYVKWNNLFFSHDFVKINLEQAINVIDAKLNKLDNSLVDSKLFAKHGKFEVLNLEKGYFIKDTVTQKGAYITVFHHKNDIDKYLENLNEKICNEIVSAFQLWLKKNKK